MSIAQHAFPFRVGPSPVESNAWVGAPPKPSPSPARPVSGFGRGLRRADRTRGRPDALLTCPDGSSGRGARGPAPYDEANVPRSRPVLAACIAGPGETGSAAPRAGQRAVALSAADTVGA